MIQELSIYLLSDHPNTLMLYHANSMGSYTIPVITRFVADFLGFWDSVKTPANTQRKYNENQIYQHIHNCQAYLAYCSDETTIWKRRVAFKASIQFLKERSEYGVQQAQEGVFGTWFSRNLRTEGDQDYVVKLREFGVTAIRALIKRLGNSEKVAAMMLAIVLDAAHKSVMTVSCTSVYRTRRFTESSSSPRYWLTSSIIPTRTSRMFRNGFVFKTLLMRRQIQSKHLKVLSVMY